MKRGKTCYQSGSRLKLKTLNNNTDDKQGKDKKKYWSLME